MPFRRRRRAKVPGVPPPPVSKTPAPKAGDLKEIYKKLVSANISNRISAFFEAFGWYDDAIKYWLNKGFKMTPEVMKKFGQANKSRNLAIGASTEQEKEAASIRAVALLEKIFDKESPISYKPYYKKYEENKVVLEAKEAAASVRFQTVLEALNQAFKPLNLSFELVKSTNSGGLREYGGEGKILLTIALAKELNHKIKTEGLLPALFSEAYTVIKSAGVEKVADPDAPGQTKHHANLQKMLESVPLVFEGILNYVNSAPKGKIFKQYSGVLEASVALASTSSNSTPKVSTPRAPRSPGSTHRPKVARGGGNLVGGRYQAGSAMAELYNRLSDQKVHALSDIFKGLAVNNPKDRLKYLTKHGARSGKWNIVQQGNTIQMVIP